MIEVEIPGKEKIILNYLVSDFTGTLSVDGNLIPGVKEKLNELAEKLKIYILTADTFGKAKTALEGVKAEVIILSPGNEDVQKEEFVKKLGAEKVVAFGNGRNDRRLLKVAKIGIAVLLEEGCAVETLLNADIVVKSPIDAIDLLLNPKRLIADLRA
ncbi:MAG: HAD hydrolase family protein [Thermodesulfobacteriaceae bacterium]|nr:HAD hydrolase family protein [Thermodesulfobacteriaceae bacterium]MCX8041398.1 HAD hydrolase family protein [Thermodesulfobacteriaceae bacterium]MDW8135816.1 HAD hydrolase family protein [Thermodesulfobacterium sp.]